MSHLMNALLCGPKATIEYLVNETICLIADTAEKIETKAVEKEAMEQKVRDRVAAEKAAAQKKEIVEFKTIQETVDSVLNTRFSTIDDNKETTLTGDELVNTVERIIDTVVERSSLNLDDEATRDHIKLLVLTTLVLINKANLVEIMNNDEFNISTRDDLVEINTIHRFFTGTKLFDSISCIQISEFITSQLLYEVVNVVGETDDWNLEANMNEIITKAYKKLEMESITNGKNNGLDEIDPVAPIRFDNSVLNVDFVDKNSRIPRMNKTAKEYIINYLNSILGDYVKKNNIIIDVDRKIDQYDNNKDTGMAEVKVVYDDGMGILFDLDLDSVVGNGYSLAVNCQWAGQIYLAYVNIEKFPEIVTKAIISKNTYVLNDPNNPDSCVEYIKVMQDLCGVQINGEVLYPFFDFSEMSKHFAFMTNEEKTNFANNLYNIRHNINWPSIGLGVSMPRMRIRKFDNSNKFTLVSDSKTRHQYPYFNEVINCTNRNSANYKKYFNDVKEVNSSGQVVEPDLFVLKFDNGELSAAYNGRIIPLNIGNDATKPDTSQIVR